MLIFDKSKVYEVNEHGNSCGCPGISRNDGVDAYSSVLFVTT